MFSFFHIMRPFSVLLFATFHANVRYKVLAIGCIAFYCMLNAECCKRRLIPYFELMCVYSIQTTYEDKWKKNASNFK